MPNSAFTERREVTVQDWENLKASYAEAVEALDGEFTDQSIPIQRFCGSMLTNIDLGDDLNRGVHLLRGVMRECTRFLTQYRDPAVLFTTPTATTRASSPGALTPTDERLRRDWGNDSMEIVPDETTHSRVHHLSKPSSGTHEHLSGALRIKGERPTAFHSIYGCTLFLYGHLLSNIPSANLTAEGESKDPMSYYMAAIEVFEQAESLPNITNSCDAAIRNTFADRNRAHLEDWLMAIAWGRSLVGLAKGYLPSSSGGNVTFYLQDKDWLI